MKSKKPFDQYTEDEIDAYRHNFVKATLRKASYRWPWRNLVAGRARISRGLYECNNCKKVVRNKDKKIDHIHPVVNVRKGFVGWNTFSKRLFCKSEGFQVLCDPCHKIKTDKENIERKTIRDENRRKKV